MYNKNYFLIIFNKRMEILALQKKLLKKWELPHISSSKEKPIHACIEDFFRNNLSVPFKYIGESSVIDKYEWPKEFLAVTGKGGEENHFLYVELKDNIDKKNIMGKEILDYDFCDYNELVNLVVFKNHRELLRKVIDELHKRRHEQKEEVRKAINYDDYLHIDKI